MRSGLLLRAPAAPRPRQHTHRRRRQGFNIQKRSASVSIVTDGAEEGESSSEVDTCALDSFLAAKGAAALLGWTVVHHRDGAAVGTVAEVLSTAGGEVVFDVSGDGDGAGDATLDPLADLLVLGALPGADDDNPENVLLRVQGIGREYEWHVFVPLVSALVPTLSPHNKVVHITPPDGLLELGERPHLIAWLKQELQPYLSALPLGGTSGARPQRMPKRTELLRNGRPDLIDHITRAGGFAAVGAHLRLRGARKPVGYWDDIDIVASELREFVESHWTMHSDDGDGDAAADEPYWYNDITGQLRWDPPPVAGTDSDLEEEEEDEEEDDFATDLVMPPVRALVAGGRWDLVSAVNMHGGSRVVADQLGWTAAPRWGGRHLAAFDTLADELHAFCADVEGDDDEAHEESVAAGGNEPDGGVMPTLDELRSSGRTDLMEAVRRHGGATVVAARLGWRLKRSPKGKWTSPAATARELRAFMRAQGGKSDRLPTRAELKAAGRTDLVYALSLHGAATVAAKLKLKHNSRSTGSRRPFTDAREFARALNLRDQTEWQAWCRSNTRPVDIPSNPAVAYKDVGWTSWTDFLMTEQQQQASTFTPPRKPRQRRSAAAVAALASALKSHQGLTE